MTGSTLETLEGYIPARNKSRAELVSMCGISEKTIDRWCTQSVRPHPAKIRKVAKALKIPFDNAYAMIENGQKAKEESDTLRELRYAMAVINFCGERESTSAEDTQLIRRQLRKIRVATKRAAAELVAAATESAVV